MTGRFPRRSTMFATVVAAATALGAIGFAGIVRRGHRRRNPRIELGPKATPGMDAMKAQYRRPATIPFPKENPYTPEKATLGKKLYFDTRLSVTSAQSCASCHGPGFAGVTVWPSVSATAWRNLAGTRQPSSMPRGAKFHVGRPPGDARGAGARPDPGRRRDEHAAEQLMARLASIGEYKPMFATAFPNEGMTTKTLAKAIATYERTVVSERAPFDAWIEGNEKAISEEAKRGFAVFNGKALCSSCHEGWNFTNDGFQDIGLPSKDVGRGEFMPGVIKMQHAFKTRGCARSRAEAPSCTTDRSPRWKRWLIIMITAVSTVRAVPI